MKNRFLLSLLLLPLLFTGCGKGVFIPGKQVRFQVTSPEVQTRTAYEGSVSDGIERINWISGTDELRIYCAQSPTTSADYKIDEVTSQGVKSIATIVAVGESVTFGGEEEHTFYGIYPSPTMFGSEPDASAFSITDERATWKIPATQKVTRVGTSNVYAPDMRYAALLAKATGTAADETVAIPFYPMFDAFQFSISSGENETVHVTSFTMTQGGDNALLAGSIYTATTMDGEPNEYYPLDAKQIAVVEGTTTSASITVDFTNLTDGSLVLTQEGGPVTFTIFTLPLNLDALTIAFDGTETGTVTLALKEKNGPSIKFSRCRKYNISGLSFPKVDNGTATGSEINWNGTIGEDLYWQGALGEDVTWLN